MIVQDLINALQSIAPLQLAEPWDKVGLQVGRPSRPVDGPVLLTIDLTEAVIAEAIAMKAVAIISYHPTVWEPLKRLTDATPKERAITRAIREDIAIYSPHTSLDNAQGCMTDWLCEGVSGSSRPGHIAGDCRALAARGVPRPTQECKVVTFVPEASIDKLRQALATAGAGLIGNYSVCSFAVPGAGTFLGGAGSSPVVGRAGRIEQVPELRLEMVCSRAGLPLVLATLREFHPYEEPAVDVYELVPQMQRSMGAGRRIVLDQPVSLEELAGRLKSFLTCGGRAPTIHLARCGSMSSVTHIGIVCGSGSEQAGIARDEGCELFITGEMKHHEVLAALDRGMSVMLAGHTNTERGYLPRLAEQLLVRLPGVNVVVSAADADPLTAM
ncbi:MAG: Nif3-like dinuclear metal center hexameric protein [Phycisphaerales bacterium]|nr:Nif3-like dinuclear metal center hexameric protein [Phycisphaerales bacterium]